MPNVKTLTTIAIATLFAAPAIAQDAAEELTIDAAVNTVASDFLSADLDQNGGLNADEFVTFAVMRAEDGDDAFKDVVLSGEYAPKFAAHDMDASGSIEMSELGAQEASDSMSPDMEPEAMEPESMEPDVDDLTVPDMN